MKFKNKLASLLITIAVLLVLYILGVVFEPERRSSRSASYSWLDPKITDRIDRITIRQAAGEGPSETLTLLLINNKWHVLNNDNPIPAKQLRVNDFISLFTKLDSYPVRSNSLSSHERLGLTESSASQVVFSGGIGQPLLNVLIGQGDNLGKNVYMRKSGQNEVRSGEDRFSAYILSNFASWYNLRLLLDDEDDYSDVRRIQRLEIYPPMAESQGPVRVFSRNGNIWSVTGMQSEDIDAGRVESYLRGILYAEGDDIYETAAVDDTLFNDRRIVLELDNGEIKILRFSAADENNSRLALVTGTDFVYRLAGWMSERLFRENDYFLK